MSETTERFELQTRLAVGHAGLVYRAVEKATRRRVALKLLGAEMAYPLDGAALKREAPRWQRLGANNIARLLEIFEDEEGMVLVHEFGEGLNWLDAAAQRRPRPGRLWTSRRN